MQFKIIKNYIFMVFGIVVITLLVWSTAFPQISEEEKRRIDFVKKLEKKKEKNSGKGVKPDKKIEENAQDAPKMEDDEIIKVDTQLVRIDVMVYDQKGNSVAGLKAEDFVIAENKLAQEIGTFSLGSSEQVPRTIVLIMDYSGSQRPYIKTSVNAAKVLVDKLNPQDRMAIVTDDVELLVDFTRDKELLKNSLDKLVKKAERGDVGKSLQFSALYVAIREMFGAEDIRPIIIFQTDGDQLLKLSNENTPIDVRYSMLSSFTDKEMLATIEKSRVTIYSVISGFSLLGLSAEERVLKATPFLERQNPFALQGNPDGILAYTQVLFRQQNAMANIAKISGGFSENLETPDQSEVIYDNILRGIANRYLIGYYSTNSERDGKRRNVKIEVRNHPEYTVLGRKFYFAPVDKPSEK